MVGRPYFGAADHCRRRIQLAVRSIRSRDLAVVRAPLSEMPKLALYFFRIDGMSGDSEQRGDG
jgi:hypothetical protein